MQKHMAAEENMALRENDKLFSMARGQGTSCIRMRRQRGDVVRKVG